MKKFLFSFGFCFSLFFSYSQCVVSFKGNNGGGNCDSLPNGDVATGTVTICFDVPVTTPPQITCVFDNSTKQFIDITFNLQKIDANGCAVYCYYEGPNKINNLFGANTSYRFCSSTCPEQIPLPVNFKSFTAIRNHSNVGLTWITAQEQNNTGFEIQSLIGNSGWQKVAFIATQAQDGNSNSELTYTYNGLNKTTGITQYRLRQVDIDNRSKFSDIRAVRGEGQVGKTIVYPNPGTNGKVNVVFEDVNTLRDVSLMDINGRMIKQWKSVSNNNLQIENLTPGFYNLRVIVIETGEQAIEKIIINNR